MSTLLPMNLPERKCVWGVTLSLIVAALIGCDRTEVEKEAPPPPGRFEAVTAKAAVSEEDLDGFCDLRNKSGYSLPAISKGSEPKGARWINLWATWCKSCVEEMPMIESWKKAHGIQVLYVSADEDPAALEKFTKEHPELPASATMNEPAKLTEWMKSLGLDAGAGLPLHLFVRSDNTVACARAAAVSEHHLEIIKNLLR